jgi:hypothetical protein
MFVLISLEFCLHFFPRQYVPAIARVFKEGEQKVWVRVASGRVAEHDGVVVAAAARQEVEVVDEQKAATVQNCAAGQQQLLGA